MDGTEQVDSFTSLASVAGSGDDRGVDGTVMVSGVRVGMLIEWGRWLVGELDVVAVGYGAR